MARYTPESIERVRDAADMLDLVGAKTELRRSGHQWMGTCPFHDRAPRGHHCRTRWDALDSHLHIAG